MLSHESQSEAEMLVGSRKKGYILRTVTAANASYWKSALLGALLAIWPFLNFISHNQQKLENYVPVLVSLALSLSPLLVVQCLLFKDDDKSKLKKANVLVGFSILFFFSFPVVHKTCHQLSFFDEYTLIVWLVLFIISIFVLFFIITYKNVLNLLLVAVLPVVLFLIVDIAYFQIDTKLFSINHHVNTVKTEGVARYDEDKLPNVYYFILDGYTRGDYLKKMFEFDNADFIDFLKNNDFLIADQAYSNMPVTKYSIPTTLNMDYYLVPGEGSLANYSRSEPFFRNYIHPAIESTPAFKAFSSIGYSIVFGSHHGTPGKESDIQYILGWSKGVKYEYIEVLKMTPVLELCQELHIDFDAIEYRVQQDPISVLQQVEEIRDGSVSKQMFGHPYLFFAHLLAPHPPFIFNADCTKREDYKFDFDIETTNDILRSNEARDAYINQMICINSKMKDVIQSLVEKDPNSIIVIQADHGWPKGVSQESLDEAAALSFRYAILNSIRAKIPGADELFYPAMSPVNTFRYILALLAQDGPDLLPDRSFKVHGDDVHELTESMSRQRISEIATRKNSN